MDVPEVVVRSLVLEKLSRMPTASLRVWKACRKGVVSSGCMARVVSSRQAMRAAEVPQPSSPG